MTRPSRRTSSWMSLAIAAAGLGLLGCGEQAGNDVTTTPDEVISPTVPAGDPSVIDEEVIVVDPPADEPEPAGGAAIIEPDPAPPDEPAPIDDDPASEEPETSSIRDEEASRRIALETGLVASAMSLLPAVEEELPPVSYEELLQRIAASDARLTLVDCWASWCDPCKENFPHVIEMADTFGDKGLKVIALSFDAGTEVDDIDAAQITEARRFLAELDVSKVENLRHGQLLGESFEAFNITTIPAVFLYDAEGKEIVRFTYDDPTNQFTYDEVEAKVAELLGVEAGR